MKVGIINTTYQSKVLFKGHTENINYKRTTYNDNYSLESSKYTCSYPENVITSSKFYYPNSSIERTSCSKLKVYFADPQEGITPEIRNTHGYIVYDNEPKFPSLEAIREKYHSYYANDKNYNSYLKTIHEYHERLKTADNKELVSLEERRRQAQRNFEEADKYKTRYDQQFVENPWNIVPEEKEKADYYYHNAVKDLYYIDEKIKYYNDRIKYSQEQQILANDLYDILKEAEPMIEKRNKYRKEQDDLVVYQKGNKYRPHIDDSKKIPQMTEEIKSVLLDKEEQLSVTKSWLDLQTREYNELLEYRKNGYGDIEKEKQYEKEIADIKNKIGILETDIKNVKNSLEFFKTLPKELEKREVCVQDALSKLSKLFTKVETFYKNNASKIKCVV